jgi:hypothetical protein
MSANREITIEVALNCLYTDFLMLDEGVWTPDHHSITDSISMVERIAEILDIGLQDTREDL